LLLLSSRRDLGYLLQLLGRVPLIGRGDEKLEESLKRQKKRTTTETAQMIVEGMMILTTRYFCLY